MRRSDGDLLLTRFWSKVDQRPDGCWIWTAALTRNGYGRFKVCGVMHMAHRFAYELLADSIPDGFTLDHLCRKPACVNPGHLEPTTMRVNVLRGETVTAANASKTHCRKGHPLSGDNLFIRRDGRRRCRTCERTTQKRFRMTDEYRAKHAGAERQRRKDRAQ